MRHIITGSLLVLTALVGYYLGKLNHERKPEPAWECYNWLWGDLDAMREHHLEGMGAREVYHYCAEISQPQSADPVLTALKSYPVPPIAVEAQQPSIVTVDCDCYEPEVNCFLDEHPEPSFLSPEVPATHQ